MKPGMFDSAASFARLFTPVEGGYLYYPSATEGGRLVTAQEYEELARDWQRVAGWRGTWKAAGLVVLAVSLWTLASEVLKLPGWTPWIFNLGAAAGFIGWIYWTSLAPRRLVRGRPAVVPPRPRAEARREARAMVDWPMIVFGLVLAGATLLAQLGSPDRTPTWWAWALGSGLFLALYLWIAIDKLRDRH